MLVCVCVCVCVGMPLCDCVLVCLYMCVCVCERERERERVYVFLKRSLTGDRECLYGTSPGGYFLNLVLYLKEAKDSSDMLIKY